MKYFMIIMLALLFCLSAKATELYPLSAAKQQQFNQLLSELRCLVCQNASLADSNASLAADMRRQIYRAILQGKTNQAIKQQLVQQYGDFILFKPPVQSNTLLLWFLPIIILLIGLLIGWRVIRKAETVS